MKTGSIMRQTLVGTAVLFASLAAGLLRPAQADTILVATLSGANEVPPNASPATGFGTFTLNTAMTLLTVDINFAGLTAPDTAAHIHCCATPGIITPVALSFVGFGFPLGVTSGTFAHTFTLATDLSGITVPAFTAALLSDLAYFNIHDASFPGGEIRGQLVVTPEPATLFLLASSLAAVGCIPFIRRRRL